MSDNNEDDNLLMTASDDGDTNINIIEPSESDRVDRFLLRFERRQRHRRQLDQQLHFRQLMPTDCSAMHELCSQWFPVDYPRVWYSAVTSRQLKYFSVCLADCQDDRLAAFIVVDIKSAEKELLPEDRAIGKWPEWQGEDVLVAYLMVIGVVARYRRHGLARLLLDCLEAYLREYYNGSAGSGSGGRCAAIYLHVLSDNQIAMRLYEASHFSSLSFLPAYYVIDGEHRDAFCYARYINEATASQRFCPMPPLLSLLCRWCGVASRRAFARVRRSCCSMMASALVRLGYSSSSNSSTIGEQLA